MGDHFEACWRDLSPASHALTVRARVQPLQSRADLLDRDPVRRCCLLGDRVDGRNRARLQFRQKRLTLLEALLELRPHIEGVGGLDRYVREGEICHDCSFGYKKSAASATRWVTG